MKGWRVGHRATPHTHSEAWQWVPRGKSGGGWRGDLLHTEVPVVVREGPHVHRVLKHPCQLQQLLGVGAVCSGPHMTLCPDPGDADPANSNVKWQGKKY